MRWSFRIARIAGTALYVHVTFLLLLIWVAWSNWQYGGLPEAVDGVVFILLVFLCVLLHEFGHVWAARRFGIRTPDITLLPIGGIANLERMPQRPRDELIVAAAGPAVNLVIAAVLILWVAFTSVVGGYRAHTDWANMPMVWRLATTNIALVLFNLIPAFPLDGGRMLRAVLSFRVNRAKATLWAARTGQLFAVLFAIVGLMGNPVLLLIAVFIFLAAGTESSQEQMRQIASGYRARDAMITHYESLSPGSVAEDASRLLLLTTQQEFPVIAPDGRLSGIVTRKGLIEAISATGPETPVTDFMVPRIEALPEGAPLEEAMSLISESPARAVAVNDRNGRFLGYVSAENAAELVMLANARGAPGRTAI